MGTGEQPWSVPSLGLIILDLAMNPVLVNRVAAEVLSFPSKAEARSKTCRSLAARIRSLLPLTEVEGEAALVGGFRSGKRQYSYRAFRVDGYPHGRNGTSFAILLERRASGIISSVRAAEKYHLTNREQEVLSLIIEGLTSKEIASRMAISANTVKAFLRLIMIKTGVTTRCGVVGRAVCSRA